jgi:two-component system response regulator AtoC
MIATRVLVIDDEPGLRQSLGLLLADAGYDVTSEGDARRAIERALAEPFDLILCDVRMPDLDGIAFLRRYREGDGTALVIMMSAYGGEDAALAAMKEGAYDYLPKPFRPDEVILTLRKAEEREGLRHTVAGLRAQLDGDPGERGMVVESPAMREALAVVSRVAGHATTVLITGESGTGKEVVARAIHRASPRAMQGFIGINCAAIPESLLESELFGHVRGAFTGATGDKTGLFEEADKGTLLLDEIGEMPLSLQAKLLRVLQEGEIRRVGDQRVKRVDVRVIAATARDLEADSRAGRFREDLYYRLAVVTIRLPPLRERRADIAPLARLFATRLSRRFGRPVTLAPETIEWLTAQDWRGNVRELENAVERAAVLSEREALRPADFAAGPADARGTDAMSHPAAVPEPLHEAVERAERAAIAAALAACGGNRREAAKVLGISLRTLFYKIGRYHIE